MGRFKVTGPGGVGKPGLADSMPYEVCSQMLCENLR